MSCRVICEKCGREIIPRNNCGKFKKKNPKKWREIHLDKKDITNLIKNDLSHKGALTSWRVQLIYRTLSMAGISENFSSINPYQRH